MDNFTQRIINGYQFAEPVGSGGFGVVYRAVQPALGREVAVKVILPAHAQQSDFVRRFEQEARLIARLEHPHIIPLYDYWQDAEGAFLVMRWLPTTLRDRLQRGSLPLTDAANLLDQIASALHVAHRSGVIHRDIKPDNLLLDDEGNTYLADFGIAKVTNSGFVTSTGQVIGSMAYIAPEQISGADMTPQADIYSLGLVMYEVLTGIQPFSGSSVSELLHQHLNSPLPSIRSQHPSLPSTLDAILAMATAKQPGDRYTDAIRFAQAFRAALPAARSLQPLADPLTERELEILQLIADGLTNSEIAERLYVTTATVKWYKKQIYSKLDVHTQELAIAHARSLNLIAPEPGNAPPSSPPMRAVDQTVASAVMPLVTTPAKLRLPTQTTPFVGREVEISALISLLRDSCNRLLTVLAPGGMGKTRLALEVVARCAGDYRQSAVFIPLSAVSTPEHVLSAIAGSVGVVLSGQLQPKAQLLEHFRQQQVLLVCDNFEHLLEAAPLLMEILEAAPGVKILTTSRERLNLSAEVVFSLGGMDTPPINAGSDPLAYSAVRLFVGAAQRARAAEYSPADLEQIGQISRMLQGMPLAILLAASWTDLLTVGEIAAEINRGIDFLESQWRDTPERQRSIRAVFDSSWGRLTPGEADALMKLSVFRGGFTRKAAETVAGASLRTLSGLVNKALLWMDAEGRCSIHELLRQYTAEKLSSSGAANQAQAAHSAYYLGALAAAESDLIGHNQIVTLRDIGADLENVRAAVTFAAAQHDYDRLAAAVQALWLYYFYQGAYADGDSLFGALAASLRRDPPSPARDSLLADVLAHQAHLLVFGFERARADECLSAAAPLVEASGNARIRAFYLLTRSERLPWENHLAWSLPSAREAAALYRSLGDQWGEAFASYHVGMGFFYGEEQSDEELGEALDRSRVLGEATGDRLLYATTMTGFALLLSAQSSNPSPEAVLPSMEQVLAIRRTFDNPIRVANALINVSINKAAMGRLAEAARDAEEAVAIKRLQGTLHDTVGFDDLGEIYLRMGRLAEAREVCTEALGYVFNTEHHAWRNLYRLYLMHIAYAEGSYLQAESIAAEILNEDASVSSEERHHSMTYVLAMAGLDALARGDLVAARDWCAHAEHSAEADRSRNGSMVMQTVLGLCALAEGDVSAALTRFEAAVAYLQSDYVYDLSQDYERHLALALALTGSSRAAVRLDDLDRALTDCRSVLDHAVSLNVEAFALMALIPAAEIALASGDLDQAAYLLRLVVEHPHTFAADRAEALRLAAELPLPASTTLDLWAVVDDLAHT